MGNDNLQHQGSKKMFREGKTEVQMRREERNKQMEGWWEETKRTKKGAMGTQVGPGQQC